MVTRETKFKPCYAGMFRLTVIAVGLLVCASAILPDSAHAKRFVIKLKQGASLSSRTLNISSTPVPGVRFKTGGLQISRSALAENLIPQKIRRNRKISTGATSSLENPLTRVISLYDPGDSLSIADIESLFNAADIEYIEEDHLMELFEIPRDEYFVDQWYLLNNAQSYISVERISGFLNDTLKRDSGTQDEDIGLRENYVSPRENRKKPLIGLIDTGVDIIHPELIGQIWANPDEIPGNEIDDDANGLVDDVVGYDFSGDSSSLIVQPHDNDVTDDIGHGSHIAGIIAARADGVGVVGVCPNALILPVKIFPNAFSTVSAEAVIYAVNSGVDILSVSWGSPFKSRLMQEAFEYAHAAGVFVAVAAGNSGDNRRFEPADIPSVFTVGASNSRGKVTSFSTYGSHIDIVAPGQDILSIRAAGTDMFASGGEPSVRIIDSIYMIADGTSMATPMVAAAAGLLLSVRPELRRDELENLLRQGARDIVQPYDTGASFPGPDSLSGAGFLDIGRSLALINGESVAFLSPAQNSRQTSEFNVTVLKVGNYAGSWSLEYAAGDTGSGFIWLADGIDIPVSGVLYAFSSAVASGKISFRLTDNLGHQTYLQVIVVGATVAKILSPGEGDTLKYLVGISGSTSGADYQGVRISYSYENNPEIEIYHSTAEFFEQPIFDWGVGSLPGGAYSLILRAQTSSGVVESSVNIFIESALSPGWPVDVGDFTAISPGASDLDNDGQKEIIVGTGSGVFVYDIDGTVRDGFPVSTDRDCRSAPAVYDIDGDGFKDVIFTSDSGLHVVDRFGHDLPGWPQKSPTGQMFLGYPTPIVTRLASDRDSAIVFLNDIGQIRAFSFDGSSYFYSLSGLFTRIDPNLTNDYEYRGVSIPHLTSADINGDGRNELIAAYSSPGAVSGLFVYNGRDGQPANGRQNAQVLNLVELSGVAFGDVDNDGVIDALVSGRLDRQTAKLWLRRGGEEDLPGWPIEVEDMEDWIANYPVLADLDNDNVPEIIAVFFTLGQSRIFVFKLTGEPFLEKSGGSYGEFLTAPFTLSSPAVADINGDGVPELILRSGFIFPGPGFEQVYAFSPAAEVIEGFPITTAAPRQEVFSTVYNPLIDDLDGDGMVEIALIGASNLVSIWDMPGLLSEKRWNWPRFMRDEINSATAPPPPGIGVSVYPPGTQMSGR